ncbi:MAG: hypothetical protein Q9163_006214 [Psora crenata]
MWNNDGSADAYNKSKTASQQSLRKAIFLLVSVIENGKLDNLAAASKSLPKLPINHSCFVEVGKDKVMSEKAEDVAAWSQPLKVAAVEVIDLVSDDDEEQATRPQINYDLRRRDALDEEEGTQDSQSGQWSIYEDILGEEDCDDQSIQQGVDACTLEEAHAFRKRLRLVGEDRFVKETIGSGAVTAKKLITAFGIRAPFFLDGQPDASYYPLLDLCLCRELSKREKLEEYNTFDDAVELLKNARNIIVLTGAGISTSLGIPDFRSKETGLYSKLQHLGLSDPQEVFDINLFREDPSIFYSVAKEILPTSKKFSPTHAFIRLLQDQGQLLTNFTQNIDNLEGHAGILPEKLVQCHGSFATATCIRCRHKVNGDAIYTDLKAGRVAQCPQCLRSVQDIQSGPKRKRSSNSSSKSRKRRQSYEDSTEEDEEPAVAGVMKPDITFFGEDLPDSFQKRLIDHDRDIVDLVLVIGTSLKVAPVSEVVGVIPPHVPQLYISREPCSHANFDIDLLGDSDTVITELCRRAGWALKHEMVRDCQVSIRPHEGYDSRFSIQETQA